MNNPDYALFARHVNLYFTLGACWLHWRKSENHCFHSKNSNQQWIMFDFLFLSVTKNADNESKNEYDENEKTEDADALPPVCLFLIQNIFSPHFCHKHLSNCTWNDCFFSSPFSRPLLMTSLHLRVVFHYFHLCHHTTVNLRNPSCRTENQSQYFRFPSFAFHFSVVVSR